MLLRAATSSCCRCAISARTHAARSASARTSASEDELSTLDSAMTCRAYRAARVLSPGQDDRLLRRGNRRKMAFVQDHIARCMLLKFELQMSCLRPTRQANAVHAAGQLQIFLKNSPRRRRRFIEDAQGEFRPAILTSATTVNSYVPPPPRVQQPRSIARHRPRTWRCRPPTDPARLRRPSPATTYCEAQTSRSRTRERPA